MSPERNPHWELKLETLIQEGEIPRFSAFSFLLFLCFLFVLFFSLGFWL